MDEPYSTKKLLVLRKLTRAVADFFRGQVRDYLATLAHLLRPRNVLGEFIEGYGKDSVPGAAKAFKELQTLFEGIAPARPFNLDKELERPIEIVSSALETVPLEYVHVARRDKVTKPVTITCPFVWVLSYSGYGPRRLKEVLADRIRAGDHVKEFVVHALVMHLVLSRQTAVARVMHDLRFPITSARRDLFHGLPVPYINAAISTVRPPDDVIIENTEISGMDVFEEVINVEQISGLRDPLKERLMELVRSNGEDLSPTAK
jgi:hypothetical protein